MSGTTDDLKAMILAEVPADGGAIGNQSLLTALRKQQPKLTEAKYHEARDELISEGEIAKGGGRGGSVFRILTDDAEDEDAGDADDTESDNDDDEVKFELQEAPTAFELEVQEAPTWRPGRVGKKAKKRSSAPGLAQVLSYRHPDKRANNPEVGMVHVQNDPDQPKTVWKYDPHLDPALEFDGTRAKMERLIDDALGSGDADKMREALSELKRLQEPYLTWSGKAERTNFEVDTVSLHVHERIDPASILAAIRKRLKQNEDGGETPFQQGLFDAPFENLPLRQALDFYKHEKNWSNRLIAGDSLLVMNSLLQKEGMSGQVQMIYIDPPYGIRYGSNFQPFTNKRDVKDGADADLTQEPEMIKAFRDTWELGVHSYLTYLRDRLLLAKDLLHESGSVFVQISDENINFVRDLLDEIFGRKNLCGLVAYKTTAGLSSDFLAASKDWICWYAKDRRKAKFNRLFRSKEAGLEGATQFDLVQSPLGELRKVPATDVDLQLLFEEGWLQLGHDNLTSTGFATTTDFVAKFQDQNFNLPAGNVRWKTPPEGMMRLIKAGRLMLAGNTLRYKRFLNDFPVFPLVDVWNDTGVSGFSEKKIYSVQTNPLVIERCLLMTTDPGDLVFDPTCGSGTTALVAERRGRRWITCDTSRVSITLAKQRLMTASYDYYALRYPNEGLKGGFIYKTAPHITLRSIANNPDVDAIYEKMHPAISSALADLNIALKKLRSFVPAHGVRKGEKLSFANGDALLEWEVPFHWPEAWPLDGKSAFEAFHEARSSMQRMIDNSVSEHAEPETLYDKPELDANKHRITGPFTVEAVPNPTVLVLDQAKTAAEADVAIARSGETSRQTRWRDELMKNGIRGKGGQVLKFTELETIPSLRNLHASGTLTETGERAVVSFGPEHAALEQRQVELALTEAEKLRPAPKFIVFCSFAFDPEAAKDIDEVQWAGVTLLRAQMNTDLLTEDLKRAKTTNESFWLMGQPDVELHTLPNGRWQVEVHGFDYFDTKRGELVSGGKSKIAMWSLDTDYDQRSLFPHQVFFPMAGKKEGWQRLKKSIKAELDEDLIEQFHGTVSLPFTGGENRKAAVKIVDDRGIESLKIIPLDL